MENSFKSFRILENIPSHKIKGIQSTKVQLQEAKNIRN